jgi:hypothetical protein
MAITGCDDTREINNQPASIQSDWIHKSKKESGFSTEQVSISSRSGNPLMQLDMTVRCTELESGDSGFNPIDNTYISFGLFKVESSESVRGVTLKNLWVQVDDHPISFDKYFQNYDDNPVDISENLNEIETKFAFVSALSLSEKEQKLAYLALTTNDGVYKGSKMAAAVSKSLNLEYSDFYDLPNRETIEYKLIDNPSQFETISVTYETMDGIINTEKFTIRDTSFQSVIDDCGYLVFSRD